jgi:predicted transcriptional regulator
MDELKESRGRKRGLKVPTAIFSDLLVALNLSGNGLANRCGVSAPLVAHWKKEEHIELHQLKKILALLLKAQPAEATEKEAKDRAVNYLEVILSSGSAKVTELSKTLEGVNQVATDLSGVPEKTLVGELERRGWKVSLSLKDAKD